MLKRGKALQKHRMDFKLKAEFRRALLAEFTLHLKKDCAAFLLTGVLFCDGSLLPWNCVPSNAQFDSALRAAKSLIPQDDCMRAELLKWAGKRLKKKQAAYAQNDGKVVRVNGVSALAARCLSSPVENETRITMPPETRCYYFPSKKGDKMRKVQNDGYFTGELYAIDDPHLWPVLDQCVRHSECVHSDDPIEPQFSTEAQKEVGALGSVVVQSSGRFRVSPKERNDKEQREQERTYDGEPIGEPCAP